MPETTEHLPFTAPYNHDVGPVVIPTLQPGKLPKRSEEAGKGTRQDANLGRLTSQHTSEAIRSTAVFVMLRQRE